MNYICLETGEIIFNAFETVSVNLDEMFKDVYYVQPNTATDAVMFKEQCLSVDEKQVFEPYVNLSLYKDDLKKDYDIVAKLIAKIKYRNVAFLDITELCNIFGLGDNKNLDRKLKAIAKRNIVQYSKVSRSQYRLFVNPRIFYRGNGNKKEYRYLCLKPEWNLDGKPQTLKELIVEQEFIVGIATEEKELVWQANETRIDKIFEGLGYKNQDEYGSRANKNRINKILYCNMQGFITKYIN